MLNSTRKVLEQVAADWMGKDRDWETWEHMFDTHGRNMFGATYPYLGLLFVSTPLWKRLRPLTLCLLKNWSICLMTAQGMTFMGPLGNMWCGMACRMSA